MQGTPPRMRLSMPFINLSISAMPMPNMAQRKTIARSGGSDAGIGTGSVTRKPDVRAACGPHKATAPGARMQETSRSPASVSQAEC